MAFGQTDDQYREWRMMVKGGLQSQHMGWGLTSSLAWDIIEAVSLIETYDDLEIVFITNGVGLEPRVMARYTLRIAIALKEHRHKPWVVLDETTRYLRPIFRAEGVPIAQGMIELAIFNRWNSQIIREEPSEEEKAIADEEATQA